MAAIANASVPIFVAILATRFNPGERSSGLKLAGIIVGLVGVGVLAGVHPAGGAWGVIGTLAVVLASFSYACGGLYGQRAVGHQPARCWRRRRCSTGTRPAPAGALQAAGSHAGLEAGRLAACARSRRHRDRALVLFRMLRLFGAARVSLVTYLMPVTALIYGAAILDEPLRPSMLGGLGLILGGVALGSGVWRPIRRPAAAAET